MIVRTYDDDKKSSPSVDKNYGFKSLDKTGLKLSIKIKWKNSMFFKQKIRLCGYKLWVPV